MNFLFSINHEYVKHFKATMRSICDNNACQKRMFIMNSNLTEQDKQEILSVFNNSCDITFLDLTPGFSPFIKTSPLVGTNKSFISFISVLFPLPFLPKSPIIFPLGIFKFTSFSASFLS